MDAYHEKQLDLETKIANSFRNFKAKGADKMTFGNAEASLSGLEANFAKSTSSLT